MTNRASWINDVWMNALRQLVEEKHPAMRPWVAWRLSAGQGSLKYLKSKDHAAFTKAMSERLTRNKEIDALSKPPHLSDDDVKWLTY